MKLYFCLFAAVLLGTVRVSQISVGQSKAYTSTMVGLLDTGRQSSSLSFVTPSRTEPSPLGTLEVTFPLLRSGTL